MPGQAVDEGTESAVDHVPALGGPIDLVNARYGAELINCGALVEGLRAWAEVQEWGPEEINLVAASLDLYRLVNAVAEYRYGEFGRHDDLGLAMMAAGAALGMRAGMVAQFYETAVTFLTRVVGCKHYLDGPVRIEDIAADDRVILTPEPGNPFDANAIKVTIVKGQQLGYIRRTIAGKLAARIERGASLQGKVALVMGDRGGAGERVYVEVRVGGRGTSRWRPAPKGGRLALGLHDCHKCAVDLLQVVPMEIPPICFPNPPPTASQHSRCTPGSAS